MNVDAVGLYEIAQEFNSVTKRLLVCMPFLFVVIFDALFILGCIVGLVEYLNDWYMKAFKK